MSIEDNANIDTGFKDFSVKIVDTNHPDLQIINSPNFCEAEEWIKSLGITIR